ncbi:hypothetical protein WAI453_001780 [Rhynchosporium graminicola]|uniref:Zn(2)-C6 fungal-type domain-containing protein n=1 Tax=Rhynchosporium graminicola TaxID=2792576 RepID=A0A1E1LPJ9_9HELO|nr:uncharacterized protein RCO7_09100 [Rhynchosporium commune]
MPSRRAHKKSRLGCLECKKRKVKCTEVRPSCSYCIRSNCLCVYPDPTTKAVVPKTPPDSTSGLSPQTLQSSEEAVDTFDMLDLTLMHHFTAVTALCLFSGEQQTFVWQTDIHLKARTNPILMHGILSVAAIHLAFLEPSNALRYRVRAFHHHDIGIRLFNQQLSDITSTSAHILFHFAIMVVVWAYASPIIAEDELMLDDIFSQLELARGCKTIFMLHWDSIRHTLIGSITSLTPRPTPYEVLLPPAASRAFEHLRVKVTDPIYEPVIVRLEHMFMKAYGEPDDVRTAFAWPCLIDEEVWSRFRAHETAALFLLAHYAMLLERNEGSWWWISGWSRRILSAVERVLSVSDKEALGWDIFLVHVEENRREFLGASAAGV